MDHVSCCSLLHVPGLCLLLALIPGLRAGDGNRCLQGQASSINVNTGPGQDKRAVEAVAEMGMPFIS